MSEFTVHTDARRSRILEAALVEFSKKGYRKASTNTIVREANVSKGLLFHYFISKKDLYILLVEEGLKTIQNEVFEGINFLEKDALDRIHKSSLLKINAYVKHPLFTNLFETVKNVEDEEILQRVHKKQQEVAEETYEKLFSHIDYYLFKDHLTVDRCLNVVRWTIDKLGNDWQKNHTDPTKRESFTDLEMYINQYIDLFREAFYR